MSWRRFCSVSVRLLLALSLSLGGLIPAFYAGPSDSRLAAFGVFDGAANDTQPADLGDGLQCCHDHDGSCVNCVSIPPGEFVATGTDRITMLVSTTDSPAQNFLTLHYKPPRSLQI